MLPEVADAYVEQEKLLLANQGCVVNPSTFAQYINTRDPQTLNTLPEQSTWLFAVDAVVHIGEILNTYAALDALLEQGHSQAFILKRGHSLYVHTSHVASAQSNTSSASRALFKVEPELYLDRYDWQARVEVLQYRKANYDARSSTNRIDALRSRLLTNAKTRRPIASLGELPTTASNEPVSALDKAQQGKGIINQALRKVKELAEKEQDTEKARQYSRTVERLTGVLLLVEAEVAGNVAFRFSGMATYTVAQPSMPKSGKCYLQMQFTGRKSASIRVLTGYAALSCGRASSDVDQYTSTCSLASQQPVSQSKTFQRKNGGKSRTPPSKRSAIRKENMH